MEAQDPSLMTSPGWSQRLRQSEAASSHSSYPQAPINVNGKQVLRLSFITTRTSAATTPTVVAYRPLWLHLIPCGASVSAVIATSLPFSPLELVRFTTRLSDMLKIPIGPHTVVELFRGGSRIYVSSVRELVPELERMWWAGATLTGNRAATGQLGATRDSEIKNSSRNTDGVGPEPSGSMEIDEGGPFGFTGQIVYMVRVEGAASSVLPPVDAGMGSPVAAPATLVPTATWLNTALQRKRAYIDITLCCSTRQRPSPIP